MTSDTIAAIATASGLSGIGIVRISGANALEIAKNICSASLSPREACFTHFIDQGDIVDQGIVIYFPAPNSFTGEDVIELQGHGSNIVLNQLLNLILSFDARAAKPGEFSERAFLNNKIDLIQAEAIADLIESQSQFAARSALRSLRGEFSKKINQLIEQLIKLRMFVEAGIDFPDEDIEISSNTFIEENTLSIIESIAAVVQQTERGCLIRDGVSAAIVGAPNVGKSSLLNYFAADDIAIVTAKAGTTRDVLRQEILLAGRTIKFIDTAGLRTSSDEIEQQGIKKAAAHIQSADFILFLQDVSVDGAKREQNIIDIKQELALFNIEPNFNSVFFVINNKIDLINENPSLHEKDGVIEVNISIKANLGLDLLEQALKKQLNLGGVEGDFLARNRHLSCLQSAQTSVERGLSQFKSHLASELLAEDLRLAQDALGKITGAITSDELLGEIFSSFCIGK
tara:strand:+ start:2373 stop:3743 length:1371 start_codon:yes stop_codon:yes gene_type:complete